MRLKLSLTALIFVMGIVMYVPAQANGENNGNGCRNRCGDTITNNTTNRTTNKGGTGIGTGVGVAESSSSSSSYQKQGQGQLQGQVQGQAYNGNTSVSITDNVTREVAASSAIAAAPDAPAPTAECWVSESLGIGGSVVAGGLSVGGSSARYDGSCAGFLLAGQVQGEAKVYATLMGYCLGFEQAGVENILCDGWRNVIANTDAPLPPVYVAPERLSTTRD